MIFDKNKKLNEENISLKERISKLESENSALKEKVLASEREKALQEQKGVAQVDAILNEAKQRAKELEEDALNKYRLELLRLRAFIEKWIGALPEPKERTAESKKRMALALALSEILKDNDCPKTLEEGIEILEKLNSVISGGGEQTNGFNLDEVLNPSGELDLATLCKELGVMD